MMLQCNISASNVQIGIDGLIIPDLPVDVCWWIQDTFEKYGLINVLLITPQTSDERIAFYEQCF
jgi:tryptophan synthase alpha chain